MTAINIRGTSGSGKSTLVRLVMACYQTVTPVFVTGRKRPSGYVCTRADGRSLSVVGHYETPCGGGDTVPSLDAVYCQVHEAVSRDQDVIYEGLIIQSDTRRCIELALAGRTEVLAIIMDVPLDVCLASIAERRAARGDVRALNPRNTISKMKSLDSQERKLRAGGVEVLRCGREAAFEACVARLGLHPHPDERPLQIGGHELMLFG